MPNLYLETLNIALSLGCIVLIHGRMKKCGYVAERVQQRIGLFDALKGLCVLGVVCIHSVYLTPGGLPLYRTLGFAVPFFFVSSGFLLSFRCHGPIELGEYYRKLFFRIFLIYVIFVIGTRMVKGEEMAAKDIFLDILLGRTNYNYYFIPLILQFYILFPYLVRFREKFDSLLFFCLVAVASFFFGVCNHYIQNPDWNTNPYYLVFIGKDLAYFCFGIFLSKYDIWRLTFKDVLPALAAFLLGAIILMLSSGEYILTYAYPFAAFIVAVVMYNALQNQRWLRVFEDLGQYSLVVYLVHSTIQGRVVMKYLYNEQRPWGLETLVVIGATTLLSYGFARIFMAVYQPAVACISPSKQLKKPQPCQLDRQ